MTPPGEMYRTLMFFRFIFLLYTKSTELNLIQGKMKYAPI